MTPPWRVRDRVVALDRPVVVGVLNVTPDSFSDGGKFVALDAAVAQAERMLDERADVIEVGGESTRPQGARPVDAAEETRRVVPVIRELVRRFPDVVIAVDTVKAAVAAAAHDSGAHVVNDVSAFRLDPEMGPLCARSGAGVVLMHSRGSVSEMATYRHADYNDHDGDVVDAVVHELGASVDGARGVGIDAAAIVVDPGVGFAKRGADSLAVLAALPRIVALGFPVLVGVSRKRFIGEITGAGAPAEREHGTVGANVAALMRGAKLFRVHDVRASRDALDVAWAVLSAGSTPAVAAR